MVFQFVWYPVLCVILMTLSLRTAHVQMIVTFHCCCSCCRVLCTGNCACLLGIELLYLV